MVLSTEAINHPEGCGNTHDPCLLSVPAPLTSARRPNGRRLDTSGDHLDPYHAVRIPDGAFRLIAEAAVVVGFLSYGPSKGHVPRRGATGPDAVYTD